MNKILIISIKCTILLCFYDLAAAQTSNNMSPSWSPDGTRIVFSSDRDGDMEIFVMNADGTNLMQLTGNTSQDRFPTWSPDGSQIAFYGDPEGAPEIYIMNANGTGLRKLTHRSALRRDKISWSPRGDYIVFSSNMMGENQLYSIRIDDGKLFALTPHFASYTAAWARTGDKIIFDSSRDGKVGLYVVDPEGKLETKLYETPDNIGDPEFSPDGAKIVFVSDAENPTRRYNVWIMNSDGTHHTRITNNQNSTDRNPVFSPDGSKIVFASRREGGNDIYVINSDGTDEKKLTDGNSDK